MIVETVHIKRLLLASLVLVQVLLITGNAMAAAPPVKLVLSSYLGREVNLSQTNLKSGLDAEDVCVVPSADTCQAGKASSVVGGYNSPASVAGAPNGNFYVADSGNDRIEEFKQDGTFVLMFGKGVDKTTQGDVCTAESGDTCGNGAKGAAPGQFDVPVGVAVDPTNGDLYVGEVVFTQAGDTGPYAQRVQKFTAAGEFLFEIGREVNKTTKANLCSKEDIEKAEECVGPVPPAPGATRDGGEGAPEFGKYEGVIEGNVLAVGGEDDRLYLAGEASMQEFEPDGSFRAETPLISPNMTGIAIDQATSDIFTIYNGSNVVHVTDVAGKELFDFPVKARNSGDLVTLLGIAIDSEGHVAIVAREEGQGGASQFGVLYEAGLGNYLTEFDAVSQQIKGITFSGSGHLYAAGTVGYDVLDYLPEAVAELKTGAAMCVSGPDSGSSATLGCTLEGETNPYSVEDTEVFFELGSTCALGLSTPKQTLSSVTELVPVEVTAHDLRPNETLCYRLAGEDKNVKAPEQLTGQLEEATTPTVPPRFIGKPSVSFVTSSSADMYGQLNAENAVTAYSFEYAPCNSVGECSGAEHTVVSQSAVYGTVGATLEATGLQPETVYSYRLAAINQAGEEGKCMEPGQGACEGTFTTASRPSPVAVTEAVASVDRTSALVSGFVNPDGQPSTYSFELGVFNGVTTEYGVVKSGSVGTVPVMEQLSLTGLQPGTTYAYRITARSGYGTFTGQTMTFTTLSVPVLSAPAAAELLQVPTFKFPVVHSVVHTTVKKCKRGYARGKKGNCVKLGHTPKRQKSKTKKTHH